MVIIRKITFLFFMTLSLLLPVQAFATDYYIEEFCGIHTSMPSSTIEDVRYIVSGQQTMLGTITSATVKFLVQSGDQAKIKWYDQNGSLISTETINMGSSPVTATPPSGVYRGRLVIVTSSSEGDRWVWWHCFSASGGNTHYYADPDTSGSPDPGGSTVDLSPVINKLSAIQSQLDTVISKYNAVLNQLATIQGQLTTIQGQLDTLNSNVVTKFNAVLDQLTTIQEQLTTVQGQLTTIQGQLDTLNSNVVDIYEYFSTPRTSAPMTVEMPHLTVDPTPPPVEEPYQEPYIYNRPTQQYELPPMVDSPGPLPWAPEPTIMPHDPPAEIGPPKEIEQPRQRDPVQVEPPRVQDPSNREEPRAVSPVGRDTPLAPTPVSMDPPHAQDPPNREAPRTQAPPSREEPRTVSPVGRDTPLAPAPATNREQPIIPAPPLTPEPPR